MDSLSASSQCTQLTVHSSRFAMVLTNYATQALEILIDLCEEVTMYMLSLPRFRPYGLHMIIFTKYADSVLYMHVFMEASFILYSRFPPSTTATNIHLHPDYFSLLILCLLGLFYLDMLHTL